MLRHHPHLIHLLQGHPVMRAHLLHVIHAYPVRMHHLLGREHYCKWLCGYIRSHHRLPGIDLLLGS